MTTTLNASASPPRPQVGEDSRFLTKTTLTISYNPQHKQADWVFYPLGPTQLRNCVGRTGSFRSDPELTADQTARPTDYKGSGYDRGHLSPAADNKWSKNAMTDSFFLSNVSPQPPRFNQGIWARLENLVRAWANEENGLWITTGPLLEDRLPTVGQNRVSIPRYYYKVLVTQSPRGDHKAIALLLPVDASGDLAQFALSIDELESRTGLDFNRGILNETDLESSFTPNTWNFRARYQPRPCSDSSYTFNIESPVSTN